MSPLPDFEALDEPSLRRSAVHASLAFALSAALLAVANPDAPVHQDTARDLLMARDCIDRGACAMHGATSTFLRLEQGALWIHLLEILRLAHASVHAVTLAVLAWRALACAVLFVTARRFWGLGAGYVVAAVYLLLSVLVGSSAVLWNPSLLPLPLALCCAAVSALAAGGETAHAGALGAALALSIDSHLASVLLVPVVAGLIAALARRPGAGSGAALAACAITLVVDSPEATARNLGLARDSRFTLLALVVTFALAGMAVRRPIAGVDRGQRVLIALLVLAGSAIVGLPLLGQAFGHSLRDDYFELGLPFASLAVAPLVARAVGWVERRTRQRQSVAARLVFFAPAALGVFVLCQAHRRHLVSGWTMSGAEQVTRALNRADQHFGDWYAHLRGPDVAGMLGSLAAFDSSSDAWSTMHADAPDVALVRLPRQRFVAGAPGWERIDLQGTDDVAVARTLPGFVDPARVRVCVSPTGDDEGRTTCQNIAIDANRIYAGGPLNLERRAYPGSGAIHELVRIGGGGAPYGLSYELGLRAQPGEPPHVLCTAREDSGARHWHIARIDGASYQGSLPGDRVVLEPPRSPGTVVFATTGAASESVDQWLPDFMELLATDGVLLESCSQASADATPAPSTTSQIALPDVAALQAPLDAPAGALAFWSSVGPLLRLADDGHAEGFVFTRQASLAAGGSMLIEIAVLCVLSLCNRRPRSAGLARPGGPRPP
jgi:hypothetical protein